MRRPSTATILSGGALVVAAVALMVALRAGDDTASVAPGDGQPAGLWRGLPTNQDLPSGWHMQTASVWEGSANAQLQGPGTLFGSVAIMEHQEGEQGAHLLLRDLRESADRLPGQQRATFPRLGNETVAIRREYRATGPSVGSGPTIQSVLVAWRRGAVVVQLSLSNPPIWGGTGQAGASTPIDLQQAEGLAQAIDARLQRELR